MGPNYKKTILPDGLRIISESIPAVRSISIGFWVDIGSRDEPEGLEGISHFIEHMVFKGTASRSPLDIVSYIESVGGVLNAFTSRENTCFLAKIIDLQLPRAVEILADLVFNARFDKDDINKEKKIVLDEINEVKDTPSDLVHDFFAQSIFGNHNLGKPILGSSRTIKALSKNKITSFLAANYLRRRMMVVASGNLKHNDLVRLVKRHFPDSQANHARPIKRVKPGIQPGLYVKKQNTNQTHICIGTPAVKFSHPRRAALLLLNSILGGSMSSKLFQKIREEMGMAYTVFSYLDFFMDAGVIGVYLNTEKKYAGPVITAVCDELEKLKQKKIDNKELESAKEQLKGSLVLGLENTSHRMNRLAKHELLLGKYITVDETIAEIDKITSTQVINICNKLFTPDNYAVTVLGPITRKSLENNISW
ncbi:MAG: insulinase family protein [candidate division Zixibacteria bacterium]|nr:insulinase family protein [candidate division Zixibacteria bacterium]